MLIIVPFAVIAEDTEANEPAPVQNHYTVSSTPDITLKEIGEPIHLDVIPVELDWETVYRDDTIHAHLLTTALDCEKIMDIILTDTEHMVPAEIEVIGTNILRMTFGTLIVRYFNSGNNIYLLVFYTE